MDRVISTGTGTAYLKIAEGCSNNCTYCAIPKIRGPYISRKMEDILDEAEKTKEYQKLLRLPEVKEQGRVGEYYYTIDSMIFNWKQQYKRGMEQR